MADNLELFNSHQEDVRRRADSLVRAIFILAGGTLTLSIGIFTKATAPKLNETLACILKGSWWSLFIAIVLFVLALATIIARDYAFGEKWRMQINGKLNETSRPVWVEVVIWSFAILGLISFLFGLLGQAYVATSLV